jgi:HAD superfamily hydrolase (TIGR01490 family)
MTEDGKKRAAFFDVDYTIISKSSMMLYANYMRKTGEYTGRDIMRGFYYLALYKMNLLDMETTLARASERYKGMPESHMIEVCNRWFEEQVKHYIYPEAVELIEYHRKSGDLLCLLSAVTIYLCAPMCQHLKLDGYYCNRLKAENGVFTGEMVRPLCYGKNKLDYARRFEEETGISLKECFYYSDSITDLEAMKGFGYPVAVNPDPLLRREARKLGWKIIDFKLKPAWDKNRSRGES